MRCPSTTGEDYGGLADYAAGRLSRRLVSVFDAHVSECGTCRVFVESQKKLWNVLDEWDADPVSFGFDRMLYARIDQVKERSPLRRLAVFTSGWVSNPAIPLVATLALLIAGFLAYRPARGVPEEAPKSVVVPVVDPFEVDQLNRVMEDLQLLHQLDEVKDEAAASSAM